MSQRMLGAMNAADSSGMHVIMLDSLHFTLYFSLFPPLFSCIIAFIPLLPLFIYRIIYHL